MSNMIDFESLFPTQEQTDRVRRTSRWWIWAVVVFVVILLGVWLIDVYTDWLWFDSLGQSEVLRTRLLAPIAIFVVSFLVGGAWLAANWLYAARRVASETVFPGQEAPLPGAQATRPVVLGAAMVIGALMAFGAAASWPTLLLYLQRGAFGISEPIFGRDVGFYVFGLPVYEVLQGIAVAWVVTAFIGVALIYVIGGVLELRQKVVRVPPHARRHLLALAALGVVLWAVGQYLARFGLLLASRETGVFFGPGYADVHVRLTAHTLLAVVGVLAAIVVLATARRGPLWLPVGVIVGLIAVRLVLVDITPGLVQQYRVRPDELRLETPYIENAIAMTNAAFALDTVAELEYDPSGDVTAELLAANKDTLDNIRLWDWQVLLAMFEQLQEIRTYYRFLDVDIDRYNLAEGPRQVNLAVRELDREELRNPTWVNEHLEFTHGFGVVVAPVDEVDPRGQAVLWARDIPTVTESPFDVEISQPRVYFGQAQDDGYVIVDTTESEFDYPSGSDNVRTTYDGADGVSIGTGWRKLMFALRFGDIEIMLSDALTSDSRVMFHRNITDRVRQLAPFLTYDPDPYLVVTPEGRLVWIYDAYTTTDRYPYSQPVPGNDSSLRPLAGNNYVRNSVKVVIDAYDGKPTFYVVDPDDPIIAAWTRVFPGLFETDDSMPEAFRAHWRYPEALFRAQAEIYSRYHMSRADVFYNAEDVWSVPMETRAQGEKVPVQPYYVTMRLRGEKEPEFLLMLPFTPVGRPVMISWLAARSDPAHYGELVLYRFEKGRQVDGPELIENRIDNDTDISAQLTLWSQSGSNTIRGNLLVIPIMDAILYVEPLYLAAESSRFPELKRVIAASKDRVVMEDTLDEALAALVGLSETGSAGDDDADTGGADEDRTIDVPTLVRAAREHEAAAQRALGDGDWRAFGREMELLQRNLEQLSDVLGVALPEPTPPAEPGATPSPEAAEGETGAGG